MYGVAAMVLLHYGGALGPEVETTLLGPVLMLSASVGSLAAGLPMWVLPAPLLAAAGLTMFYDTHLLRDYALFWAGAVLTGERWVAAAAALPAPLGPPLLPPRRCPPAAASRREQLNPASSSFNPVA